MAKKKGSGQKTQNNDDNDERMQPVDLDPQQNTADSDQESGSESKTKMNKRHKEELKQLEKQHKQALQKAPKDKKKKEELQLQQKKELEDLKKRHQEEKERKESEEPPNSRNINNNNNDNTNIDNEEKRRKEIFEKNRRKKLQKKEKQQQMLEELAKLTIVDPDHPLVQRKLNEAIKIAQVASDLHLDIVPIPADGNCMFRAIAVAIANLGFAPANDPKYHLDLRHNAAMYLLHNPSRFEPFLDQPITSYTHALSPTSFTPNHTSSSPSSSSSSSCDTMWGGHAELLALASLLDVKIRVLSEGEDVVVEGGEKGVVPKEVRNLPASGVVEGKELVVAYYKYQYASGEHYNATKPKN